MTDYAVGDIQGCLDPLLRLLDEVGFDPGCDRLFSVGDVVNRGPQSLETLRYLKSLGDAFEMVVGNHDLHLLAIAHGVRPPNPKDTLDEILAAPDREELLSWLQGQPLILQVGDSTLVHAGIPPFWTISEARTKADEVHSVLQSDRAGEYFSAMYGNQPDLWDEHLDGPARWRVITNYLTRMRFCDAQGRLNLTAKGTAEQPPAGYAPWFSFQRQAKNDHIVFGHWAALQGKVPGSNLHALDTGCVWGGNLRLMDLNSRQYHHTPCA